MTGYPGTSVGIGAVEGQLDGARSIADAVLLEGYVLYPYRASAEKNQARWQFGVLVPPSRAEPGTVETSRSRTQCLVELGDGAQVVVRLRFLHLVARTVERRTGAGYEPVTRLADGDRTWVAWDEATVEEVDVRIPAASLVGAPVVTPFSCTEGHAVEPVGADGRLCRQWWPLEGELRLELSPLPGPYDVHRFCLEVANTSSWQESGTDRNVALRHSLIAAHALVGVSDGHFQSLADPPEWARAYAAECVNERVWPILVGALGRSPVMLSSPIILEDDPRVAAESPGDLFDATEIDEILSLRTLTLTDAEKAEARGTDPRAAELIDRVGEMPAAVFERLHGAVRSLDAVGRIVAPDPAGLSGSPPAATGQSVPWWDPGADTAVAPDSDTVEVAGVSISRGSTIVLRPSGRGADAQDFLLAGRTATVRAVFLDVDGASHLAVTVDDDPAADLQDATGRYLYFRPDEVEPSASPR